MIPNTHRTCMSSVAPDPSAPGTMLDEAALARLRELDPDGRHGVVGRVLGAYEAALVRHLEQMRATRAAPNSELVCALAHTLKSSSASVGAAALARACALTRRPRIEPVSSMKS